MALNRTGGQAVMSDRKQSAKGAGAWLTRLARDTRGNTMAIVAMSLIPLAGMVGGGVDISRMYIVKTRLQHACDAGALAGRKQMGGGPWAYNGYEARTQAEKFFDANIQASPYGANTLTKTFTESAGKVTGTASAVLPMTIMRIFGRTTETLAVTCDAEMRLPNTDVMFVLDVTGSMASKAVSTDTQTKIEALHSAVKCFYETVARLDTTENCVGGAPSGGTGNTVQVRFGFVPYSVNVNVGKLLPLDFIADRWSYQSREPLYRKEQQTTWTDGTPTLVSGVQGTESTGNWSTQNTIWGQANQTPAQDQTWCAGLVPENTEWAATGTEGSRQNVQTTTQGTTRVTTWYTNQAGARYEYRYQWTNTSSNPRRCQIQRRTVTSTLRRNYSQTDTGTTVEVDVFDRYRYAFLEKDVSALKDRASNTWNSSFVTNTGNNGAAATIGWDGCIEERPTVRQATYSPIPSGAKDLDIDLVPSTSDSTTQWGPMLRGLIYTRRGSQSNWDLAPVETPSNYGNSSSYSCPPEARLLQRWDTASTFETYVDNLLPTSNTYHDIGLLWGARFISPTGIFRAQNQFTPQGAEIERHLIFMTDGEACTENYNYTAYGVAWFDRRQTDEGSVPTDGCLTTGTITQQVNARTAALCTAVKNKNITLWVIWFGTANSTIEDMLENCATSGRFFTARNSTDLQTTFRSIADQISQLRLTK
jgi:Flp pilus assembly protein TadG